MAFHRITMIPIPQGKIVFIMGEHAHSQYFSEDADELAEEPKELYIVPNAGHVVCMTRRI
ncbi:hypothetical protein [Neobacillus vireti]|uniref:hypothetical protein n=1 Tax=Neobacillus vireti TaxID=220686 RepID=UPI002FFDF291